MIWAYVWKMNEYIQLWLLSLLYVIDKGRYSMYPPSLIRQDTNAVSSNRLAFWSIDNSIFAFLMAFKMLIYQ